MGNLLLHLFLIVALLQCSLAQAESSGPVVALKAGAVRGHYRTVKGAEQQVEEYLGIPFAHPPLGPLRFAAPQPAESWEGVRDATMMPKIPPGWDQGMKREDVVSVMDILCANEPILNEYLRQSDFPENIRGAFTETLGDMVLVLPVLKVSECASACLRVSPLMHSGTRPAFVKADHYVDALFFLGSAFCAGHTVVTGPVSQEEEELSKLAMAYIANFAHNGLPNGPEVVERPRYDHNENYLKLNLQQTVGRGLRQNRAHFLDVVLPDKLAASHPANDEL